MDFMRLAQKRRSVRDFSRRTVSREDLERCVEAARYSPSACNSQPWKFIIASDPDLRDKIAADCFKGAYSMNAFASEAAAYIAIVSEDIRLPALIGGRLRGTDFHSIDNGIACAHLVLEACELGIGTCILGWFDEKRLKKILKVPRRKKIDLLIALGHPSPVDPPGKQLKERTRVVGFDGYA